MINYCLEELKHKAEVYKKTGCINLFHGDVVKSDVVIPNHLQAALKVAVAPLENFPTFSEKDWHPESDEKVLDIVHPSLFPLVYGTSRIVVDEKKPLDRETGLRMSGAGEIVPVPAKEEQGRAFYGAAFSRKFQWLPCDVDISGDQTK